MGKKELLGILIVIVLIAGLIFLTNRPHTDWKVYQDSHISLSYPSNWRSMQIQGDSQGVEFTDNGKEVLSIRYRSDSRTLDQVKAQYTNSTNVSIGGMNGVKTPGDLYILKSAGDLLVAIDGSSAEAPKYINQILQSFRFSK